VCVCSYLLEFVEVGFGFEVEDGGRFGVVAGWLPVFYHSACVDAYYTVVDGVICHYMDGSDVEFFDGMNGRGIFAGIIDMYCW